MAWSAAAFWTHGVNTIVEFPERTIGIRRTGYGTIAQQMSGVEKNNWFHLPLHTVNNMDGELSHVKEVTFRLRLNEFVVLKEVHVRYGHELIFDKAVHFEGPDIDKTIDLYENLDGIGPQKNQNGLVLCLRFDFLDELDFGEVIFYGAGIRYSEEG